MIEELKVLFEEFIEETSIDEIEINEATNYGKIYNKIMKAMKNREYISVVYKGEFEGEQTHMRLIEPWTIGRGFISHSSGTPKEVNTTTRYLRGYIIFDTSDEEGTADLFEPKTKIGKIFKKGKKSYSVSGKSDTGWRLFRIDRIKKIKIHSRKKFNKLREDYNEDDKTFVNVLYSVPKALVKENFILFTEYFESLID